MHEQRDLRCGRAAKPLELNEGLDGSVVLRWPGPLPPGWLTAALDQIFVSDPAPPAVVLPYRQWHEEPQALALFEQLESDIVHRAAFWQLPLWLTGARPAPVIGAELDGQGEFYHPKRPARPSGEVYRRYDPRIRRTLSFRVADVREDGERLTRWMNDPRVAYFWEQTGSRAEQEAYLRRQLAGPQSFPVIGCFDDQPFGYFEVYWGPEDRVGRHYCWLPYDRGYHMLVGEAAWRGVSFAKSWTRGLMHYLWLDEPRTLRLVGEPRVDNRAVIRHLPRAGYRVLKEIDLPNKRACLVIAERHNFFTEIGL